MNLDIVIMAAGKGTRMKSKTPKVLHKLAGKPLLGHVLSTAAQLQARRVVLIAGHDAPKIIAYSQDFAAASGHFDFKTVMQMPQLGTGHAVQQAAPELPDDGMALVLSGDVPLIDASTLEALIAASGGDKIALLSIELDNPHGYGRVIRSVQDANSVVAIVEQKDGKPQELAVKEIYSGMMAAPARLLKQYLSLLRDDNAQKEFYLTDVVKHAVAAGTPVVAHTITDPLQVAGVNSPLQLQELEREYQHRLAKRLLEQGVRIADAKRFDVRGTLSCGQDVSIDIGCLFEGQVSLADDVSVGAHCVLANCSIGAGVVIHPYTHIDGEKLGVKVGAGSLVGPFARLRPGADLGQEVHIGNFVEVKNSTLAKGAKANHLAYLGDATVGERVNYGAGSITANYDGANKHRTVLGADVHVGSNCVLVAPVTVGSGSTVGGGSTITKDVPEKSLVVARGKQTHIEGWSRPVKKVSK